ncbi:hypothetical protein SNEBB_004036 [Seison nebaliae]|nr:hypothetical protein SNEBB_004036 [Seison nebaliae]
MHSTDQRKRRPTNNSDTSSAAKRCLIDENQRTNVRRNERERRRVRAINEYFIRLQDELPLENVEPNKYITNHRSYPPNKSANSPSSNESLNSIEADRRLSKIETLKRTINYIKELRSSLKEISDFIGIDVLKNVHEKCNISSNTTLEFSEVTQSLRTMKNNENYELSLANQLQEKSKEDIEQLTKHLTERTNQNLSSQSSYTATTNDAISMYSDMFIPASHVTAMALANKDSSSSYVYAKRTENIKNEYSYYTPLLPGSIDTPESYQLYPYNLQATYNKFEVSYPKW